MNTKSLFMVAMTGFLACATACKKADKTTPDDTPPSATNENLKKVGSHLDAVSAGLLPDSLKTSTAGLNLSDSNICSGTAGLFDCQPNLVKAYASLSQDVFVEVNAIVKTLAEALANSDLGPGAKGEVNAQQDSDSSFTKFEYDVTTADTFRILIHTENGPFIYVKATQNTYVVKADMSKDGQGSSSTLSANVVYTDDDNFSATVQLSGTACSPGNIRQPQTVVVDASSVAGLKQGKAMLYMPRWLYSDSDSVTCDTTPTDAMKMTLYTDYVGDSVNTTASVYMLPVSVTDVTKFSDFEASKFCSNNPTHCVNGKSLGDSNVIATTYTNPFCIKDSKGTWGAACTNDNASISKPDYSAATRWITPASIQALAVTLPSSL